MYDSNVLWLPGFEPNTTEKTAPAPAPATHRKVLAREVEQVVSIARFPDIWPAMPDTLWDCAFTQSARFSMNLKALETVRALTPGSKPSQSQAETLNQFTGWGALSGHTALSQRFARSAMMPAAKDEADTIEALLGEDGLDSARKAMTTSFFTPSPVARALWKGLEAIGFKGGNILEPSAGAGMLLAQMPAHLAASSQVTAIELDASTAGVLRALYEPYGVKVDNVGYEKASLPVDYFDLVVTNVPFGDFRVPERRPVAYRDFLIHDYFIAKSLDMVREGGIVAVLTSSGTMEKQNDTVRHYIGSRAKLLTAVRLPSDTFKAFAGTSPTVDVLIFQRLCGSEVVGNTKRWGSCLMTPADWCKLDSSVDWMLFEKERKINRWFIDHPDHLLGTQSLRSSRFGKEVYCRTDGQDYLAKLESLLGSLPESYIPPGVHSRDNAKSIHVDPATLPGTYLVANDGSLLEAYTNASMSVSARPIDPATGKKTQERIRGMIAVRDAARELIEADMANDGDHVAERALLNRVYDQFKRRFGALTASANTRAFRGDPGASLLYSLELVKPGTAPMKAEIFSRRTIDAPKQVVQCDTPAQALPVSLTEKGYVDLQRIAELCNMDEAKVADALIDDGIAYLDPASKRWEVAEAYLSGDVKTKLDQARYAGKDYERNVDALRHVQPADLTCDQITAKLGSTWIPGAIYLDFVVEKLMEGNPGGQSKASVRMDKATAKWAVEDAYEHCVGVAARNRYAAGNKKVLEVLEMTLNQQAVTLYMPHPSDPNKRMVDQTATLEAREKQDLLKSDFVEWLWSDEERREAMTRCYNDRMNRIVTRHYDGSHLTLPGFSNVYSLRPHQKDGVWRAVSCGTNCLFGHKVGAGKTLEMICSAMELKRLGLATKPAFAVPNNALQDFAKEFVKAYPAANILVATEKDFAARNRRRFLARIATANWDAVILTHPSFERIRMGDEYLEGFIEERLKELSLALETAKSGSRKEIERRKRKWEARLDRLANAKGDKEEMLTFEMLGIDWLFVDEAHYFKNLYRFSSMDRVAGLPNNDSERSFDMLMKVRYVQSLHRGGGVCFATGTPVSNSMAELFAMQVYLQPETLMGYNVASFDAWAATFGEVVTAVEVAPDGSGYRMNSRFAKFVNLPELMGMFHEVADIKTAENLKLPEPDHDKETIAVTPSDTLRRFVEDLAARAEAIRNGYVEPKVDNMLKITSEGRMAALDLRMLGMSQPAGGKIDRLVENVLRIHRNGEADRLAQVVFCDLGTPGGSSFCVYDAIRDDLVAAGVDPSEIAYIHDAKTHAAKKAMTERVNEGDVRIILGSTTRLGVAANLQRRLIALHHLDAPWRPSDIEQREGRILRQGNTNDRVTIYRYVTEGSFDAYLWQTLETKARFISQVMVSENVSRSAEDVELAALSYAEVKALASGNPMVLEKVAVDAKVAKLAVLRSAHITSNYRMRGAIQQLPERIQAAIRRKAGLEQDITSCNAMQGLSLDTPHGRVTDPRMIGAVIEKTVKQSVFPGCTPVKVGVLGSFVLTVSKPFSGSKYRITLDGACSHDASFTGRGPNAVAAIEVLIADMPRDSAMIEERIVSDQRKLESMRFEVDQPFDQEDRYQELLTRQAEINANLDIKEAPRSSQAA